MKNINNTYEQLTNANKKLLDIAYKITSQKNFSMILETILLGAKELSNSDGGTLYLYNPKQSTLEFKIASNDTLKIHYNSEDSELNWNPLQIYNEDKSPNLKNVAVVSAIQDKLINIPDVYESTDFDFSGAMAFDKSQNYKTKSMLVLPMKNKDDDLIGVIQLINKQENNITIDFTQEDELLIKAMASLATMIIENNQLVIDLEALLYGLIDSVNKALSEKSKYTQKHNDNVAILTKIIADGINKNKTIYEEIEYTDIEMEELRLSAMLHDIGKVTTPVHIMDKATKLETIYDRLHTIKLRIELAKKDLEISYLKNEIDETTKLERMEELQSNFELIERLNNGEYFAKDEEYDQATAIAE
ncbi:MAG: GAF domain-containing protein, partial [Arcobacteraceae bacterium]